MPKILSQSGISLSDVYDVEGSVAGIETLETRELPIVHEMGGTVFSERMGGNHSRLVTAALNQNTTFDILSTEMGPGVNRILGVAVFGDASARTEHAMVAVRDTESEREIPIWIWDQANNFESTIRIIDNGAAVGSQEALIGSALLLPSFVFGTDQPEQIRQFAFRGLTTGFGAGTITLKCLIYRAFAARTGLSSHGLPIPSW